MKLKVVRSTEKTLKHGQPISIMSNGQTVEIRSITNLNYQLFIHEARVTWHMDDATTEIDICGFASNPEDNETFRQVRIQAK